MGYNQSKDKNLWEKKADCGMFNIIVGVYCYDGGKPKLQLSREQLQEQGNAMFRKLGRLSLVELNEVLPVIDEAMGFMKGIKSVEGVEGVEGVEE